MIEMSSNFFANMALMKPASAKTVDDRSTTEIVTSRCWTCSRVKNSAITVTNAPTIKPRKTPPATCPIMIAEFDIGDTSISSRWRPNFAPKNDDTTLP